MEEGRGLRNGDSTNSAHNTLSIEKVGFGWVGGNWKERRVRGRTEGVRSSLSVERAHLGQIGCVGGTCGSQNMDALRLLLRRPCYLIRGESGLRGGMVGWGNV